MYLGFGIREPFAICEQVELNRYNFEQKKKKVRKFDNFAILLTSRLSEKELQDNSATLEQVHELDSFISHMARRQDEFESEAIRTP